MSGIQEQAYQFQLSGTPMFCTNYGNGHINETYLVLDTRANLYILQKINKDVFTNPEALMKNVAAVAAYLKERSTTPRDEVTLVPTLDGKDWLVDSHGEYWRMYNFISYAVCLEQASTPAEFRESGFAFGDFQRKLAEFPAHTLAETIPHFHDTPKRFETFRAAVAADKMGRAKDVEREIEFTLAREEYASTLMDKQRSGELPLRVTHNDTKLNNVLLDCDTHKTLCVLDLDTVMPGLSVTDFGDSIRFGASTATEDEKDLDKVTMSLELLSAYTEGFLRACGKSLTDCELAHLADGAKMMTLECGTRFLTDYLQGDAYFRTHYEGHNLDRCRTQYKLVADMETKWSDMQVIIEREARK